MKVKGDCGRLKSGTRWIWLENPAYYTIGKSIANASSPKTVDELAKEVINGLLGHGAKERQCLM